MQANEGRQSLARRQASEAALTGAEAQIAGLNQTAARLQQSVSDYEAALAAVDARKAELERENEQHRTELDAARQNLAALQGRERQLTAREAELVAAQTAVSASSQAALAAVRAEHAALQAEYHLLVSSPAWRATSPAREIGRRFPQLARRTVSLAALSAAAVKGELPARLRLRQQVRADRATLLASPLFDPAGYLVRYPDVARSGSDPLWHYIWSGATAGYDPHPLFDSGWYLERHPDVAAKGINPLAHYLREGAAAGYDPHPLFDTSFYRSQENEAGGNALLHFLEVGAQRGRNPNKLFDTDLYWNDYLKGRDSSLDPLSHYVLHGAASGYDPHPSFDTDWYAATYRVGAGTNPLAHYIATGKALGHFPSLLAKHLGDAVPDLSFALEDAPVVSIIVPVYGRSCDTLRCLASVMTTVDEALAYEVIVIDDRPDAPVTDRLGQVPGLHLHRNSENLGFLRSCKRAASQASGRYLLFLNNDTIVHPGWLDAMVRLAEADARVGMVGAKLLNADGTVQEAGGIMHRNGWGFPYGRGDDDGKPQYGFVREVDVVVGACMLIRMSAWNEVGGFDERYAPAYYEEFDFAFALRDRGWRVMFQPASVVTHFDSASYGTVERDRQSTINHAKFCQKWEKALHNQPAADAPSYLARERPLPGHILIVDDRVPEPDKHAGAIATFDWLRLLRGMGLRVTFYPHDRRCPEPYTARLQQMGVEVLYGDLDARDWIRENGPYLDWVWLARPAVAQPLLEAVRDHAGGRLIYYTHDLHFLREQRRFELTGDVWHREEAWRLRRVERDVFRQARLVLTPSSDEVGFIQDLAPNIDARAIPLYTIEAADELASTESDFASRSAVLFIGGYDHVPNVDAAHWLVAEIMPLVWAVLPDITLILAGSKPPADVLALAGKRVEVPGWLPDLTPLYDRARLSLNALRFGAGVKGKIIASLQAGVPVVTTPVGNEGLGLRSGEDGLIGGTATELARHALDLLQDPALCARLANAGAAKAGVCFGEYAMRAALMAAVQRDVCPVCGRFAVAESPVLVCDACGAGPVERALADAVLVPHRAAGVASLREAVPLIGHASMPDGPLRAALGRTDLPPLDLPTLDLLVTIDAGESATAQRAMMRPGGRILSPAETASPAPAGWRVRRLSGRTVVELSKQPSTASAL